MVCLRNVSVDTLQKGDTEEEDDDDDDDNNNNNNNNNNNCIVYFRKVPFPALYTRIPTGRAL
jgi:hypothetical protein